MTLAWTWPGGHAGYLAVALATHAMIGYALGARLAGRPRAGAVGALLADVDLLFPAAWGAPLVHRGITHTPLAAGVAVALAARYDRSIAVAVGIGYASQLLVDATTPKGILLAYPLSSESVAVPIGGHSPSATVLLWVACLAVLWNERSSAEAERSDRPELDS